MAIKSFFLLKSICITSICFLNLSCKNDSTAITVKKPAQTTVTDIPPPTTKPVITPPSTPAADNCNWGSLGVREFTCEEKVYIYGSATCRSGNYPSIFCKKEYKNNGKACFNDNSQETQLCYSEKIGRYFN